MRIPIVHKALPAVAFTAASLACALVIVRGGGPIVGDPLERAELWLLSAFAFAGICAAAITLSGGIWSGLLTAMLFVGGAAQLWLTEPDWFASLRLRPQNSLHVIMLGLTAMQGILSAALALYFSRLHLTKNARFGGLVRILAVLAISSAFCVSVLEYARSEDLRGLAAHLIPGALCASGFLLNAIALALAPDLPRFNGVAVRGARTIPFGLAAFVTAAAGLLAIFSFGGAALVQDETVYLFQARTFAGGELFAPLAPQGTESAFEHYLIDSDERGRFAVVAPGFALALAPFAGLGLPWLLNPLLGGVAIILIHAITRRVADLRTANLAAVLSAASPWLIFSSAALMTHALSLVLSLGATLFAFIARQKLESQSGRGSAIGLFLCAGLLMGWLFVTRALEGVLLGGALGIWLLFAVGRTSPLSIAAYGAGCILTGAMLFVFNFAYTGNIFVSPLAVYISELWGPMANGFGFGSDRGPPEGWGSLDLAKGHSPLEGVLNTQNGLSSLAYDLFGWTAGSLALIVSWILFGKHSRLTRMMLALTLVVISVHFFYWFNAAFYIGPRYWYGVFLPLIILSIAGIDAIVEKFAARDPSRVIAVVVMLSIFGATIFTSWRATEKYAARSADGRRVAALARADGYDSVLFVIADRALAEDAMIFNDPYFRGGAPIFAYAPTQEAARKLARGFQDRRQVYLSRSGE